MIFSKPFLVVQCGGMVAFAALSSRLPDLKEFRNKPPTNVLRFSPARKKFWLVAMMDGTPASRVLDVSVRAAVEAIQKLVENLVFSFSQRASNASVSHIQSLAETS